MLKKFAGLAVLGFLTVFSNVASSQQDLMCWTYFGCRPVRYQDGLACTCDSATRNCTECCVVSAGYCCTGGFC